MCQLKGNFALCISGPTNSGKSTFCVKLLENSKRMFGKEFNKIYWILGDPNAKPKDLTVPVEYIKDMPDDFQNDSGQGLLIIFDDAMMDTIENKAFATLLTRGCHHQNISVIFITQNLFHQGRYARDISLNFSHLCVMNNPRDRSQFQYLARQLYPENPRQLLNVYKQITQEPYSYLFIDLNQNTHDLLRFRTDIFNPYYSTVFCSKIPEEINDIPTNYEICGKGAAYAACFTPCQM